MRAVNLAMRIFCYVFGLTRKSSEYEFNEVVNRIRDKRFTPEEIRRATPLTPGQVEELRKLKRGVPIIDPGFFDDVIERGQLPRAWDRLADTLHADYGKDLRANIESALAARLDAVAIGVEAVFQSVRGSLLWWMLRCSGRLVRKIEDKGTFRPLLVETEYEHTQRQICPSMVFLNFDLLRRVGDSWTEFQGVLELRKRPRGYGRDDILQKRRELAKQRKAEQKPAERETQTDPMLDDEISDEEVCRLVPSSRVDESFDGPRANSRSSRRLEFSRAGGTATWASRTRSRQEAARSHRCACGNAGHDGLANNQARRRVDGGLRRACGAGRAASAELGAPRLLHVPRIVQGRQVLHE
jgi:hypothetical protein